MTGLKDFVKESVDKGYSRDEIYKQLEGKGYSKGEIAAAFVSLKQGDQITGSDDVPFGEKLKLIFGNPAGFFKRVREKSIWKSLGLFVLVQVLLLMIGFFLQLFFMSLVGGGLMGSIASSVFALVFLGIAIVGLFAYSGISHLIARGLGGQGSFTDTFNAVAYSSIPAMIFGIIPLVIYISWIYAVILIAFGISEYHKISKGKAAVPAIVPPLALIVLIVVLIVWAISQLRFI